MDLLLQAAKVLEQENSVGSPGHHVSARSTRGTYHSRTRGESQSEREDGFGDRGASLDDNTGSADDEALSGSERRRAGGAGTREVHNQLEKNRRKQMRECFNYLQQCIPTLENKRVATQSILQGAIKHIKGLKKKNVEQEREIQMLAKRKSELKRKHDLEFNKCTEDQQRMADVMIKMRKPVVHEAVPDEDGHTSDSTTTASEGPGNEDDFSDDEKMEDREKGHLSRVNPVVAAKLDGFRKRKLASLDSHPKSTDYIIASMKDAGLLTAPPPKQRTGSMSSVSSSSAALKNMLEQKKKQQTTHFVPGLATPSASSLLEKIKLDSATLPSFKSSSSTVNISKTGSSLISSHPMISNQLAALPPLPISLHNKDGVRSINSNGSSTSSSVGSSLLQTSGNSVSIPGLSYSVLNDVNASKSITLDLKADHINRQNSVIYAPTTLMTSVLEQSKVSLPTSRVRPNSFSGTLPSTDSNSKSTSEPLVTNFSRNISSADKIDIMKNPFDFSAAATANKAVLDANNAAPISVIQAPVSSPGSASATKFLSSVIPMSMLRLPINSGLTPVAVTLTPNLSASSTSSSSLDQVASATAVASQNILTQKVNANLSAHTTSEILLAPSPVKSNSIVTTPSRVTALLAPQMAATSLPTASMVKPTSTLLTTIPSAANLTSSQVTPANLSLQDTLKTMGIAPTLLPLTVTGVPLSTSVTQAVSPMTPALRFYSSIAPNSVVAAAATPLTNGQTTSIVPAVVRFGVLQNFIPTAHVQVQSPQVIAQPIVVVTAPSTIINNPVDSAPASVMGTQPSGSSSSILQQ